MLGKSSDAISSVTTVLEEMLIPYAIGGSLASSTYGHARLTQDVDIIARVGMNHVDPLVSQLSSSFYIDAEMIRGAITNQSSFNLLHLETMFKVDIFVAGNGVFEQKQLARCTKRMLVNGDMNALAYVVSAEDTILAKLRWYRMGGETSERQWRDVEGVLKVQGERLDFEYMRGMAKQIGVDDLLAVLLKSE